MKRLLAVLRTALLALGWILFLCATALLGIEESGFLTRLVEDRLAAELGSLGPRVHVERARLLWFEPGLLIEGVTFDGEHRPGAGWRAGKERLRLSSVHVRLSPSFDPRNPVERVEVRGGRVALASPLIEAAQTLISERAARDEPAPEPAITVRGIAVELELPSGELFALGSADFAITSENEKSFVRGRLSPTMGGAVSAPSFVHLTGETFDERGFTFQASARSIPVDSARMPAGEPLRLTGVEKFSGELALDFDAQFRPELGSAPEASLHLALREGDLALPEYPALEAREVKVEMDFAPEPGMSLWHPDAWAATMRVEGRYNRSDVEALALYGAHAAEGTYVEAWARVEDLPLDEQTLLAFGVDSLAPDTQYSIRDTFAALEPRGVVNTNLGLRIPRLPGHDTPLENPREITFEMLFDGRAEMTLRGWRDENGERQGFPIPCDNMRGAAIYTYNDALARSTQLALVRMSADHGSGTVYGDGLLSTPLEGDEADLDFRARFPSLAVGKTLETALQGMKGTEWVWDQFQPDGGEVTADWTLRRRAATGGLTAVGEVEFHDVNLMWSNVRVPLVDAQGGLQVRWAPRSSLVTDAPLNDYGRPRTHRPSGVMWSLETSPGRGQSIHARGFARGESLPDQVTSAQITNEPMQWFQVEFDDLLLRGDDWDALAARFPQIGEQVSDLRAQGSIDAVFRGSQPLALGPFSYDVEVSLPEKDRVFLTPRFFGRQTKDVVGRVLIHGFSTQASPEDDEVEARFALFGAWGGGVTLASAGTIPATGLARVDALGAGVDPSSPALKGALVTSFADEPGAGEGLDLSVVEIDGRLDFEARVEFEPNTESEPKNSYRIFLRDNRLRSEAFRLESMHGVFLKQGDVLASPRLQATLAGTPIEMTNVLILTLDAARAHTDDPWLSRAGSFLSEEGIALQADWSASGVSLDRAHLSPFIDPQTLDLLLDQSELSGLIDIRDARVLLISDHDGRDRVAFRGEVLPSNVSLNAGLPIDIIKATVDVGDLVLEGGRVRGWWQVKGLDSVVAGRRIEGADMTMTFVDGRLTVDNLRGGFGSGEITSLGGGEATDRALAVDLSAPYGYALALQLDGVEVDELLGGLFESSVTDLGEVTASMRLRGRGGDVMALSGSGAVRLVDARLWSIPVARELFRSLGADETAVFDRMEMRWGLNDGVIEMKDIRVRSPLLQLIGEGRVGFTGELHSDLQVRYSLLDKIGALNRVVYWLNNSLWQVALRGDLTRPQVRVRNSIFEFLFGFEDDPPRGLPLPGWSPLSSRF